MAGQLLQTDEIGDYLHKEYGSDDIGDYLHKEYTAKTLLLI